MKMQQKLSFKDFEIVKDLGSGSFGTVQLVRQKKDQKLYAIKSVLMTRLSEKERDCALNEVRLLASIRVANVIDYKGCFFHNETQSLCLVMEYANGGDLEGKVQERLSKHGGKGFDEKFIWKVAFEIFQGLKILHRNNIVHRDIKSANVFFVEGIAKLGDLNVSKVTENGMCSTQTGTPYYTSPEIWKGTKYGRKCDIWSTGCLLYEMCTLHPPFKAKDFPSLYRKVILGNFDPIPQQYSNELGELIRMCLTVDEDLRPDAQDVLETSILSGMELNLEKFKHEQEQINLLDPIKCPKVLRFLNSCLPKVQFQTQNAKKTVGFTTKKQIKLDEINDDIRVSNQEHSRARSQKIIKLKILDPSRKQLPLRASPGNKIILPEIKRGNDEVIKFINKKVNTRISQTRIMGSKKKLRAAEKENSMKFIKD